MFFNVVLFVFMVYNINADVGWILVPTWLQFGVVGASKTRRGRVQGHLGASCGRLGAFWARFGASWARLGASWKGLGSVLSASWGVLGAS